MQVTKLGPNIYRTEDYQLFDKLTDAYGHAKRLAVAHYLKVLRQNLLQSTGPLSKAEAKELSPRQKYRGLSAKEHTDGWTDSILDILEEQPAIVYEDGSHMKQRLKPNARNFSAAA